MATTLSISDIAILLEEPREICRRVAVFPPLLYCNVTV